MYQEHVMGLPIDYLSFPFQLVIEFVWLEDPPDIIQDLPQPRLYVVRWFSLIYRVSFNLDF